MSEGQAASRSGSGLGHVADGGVEVGVASGAALRSGAVAALNPGSGAALTVCEERRVSARWPTGNGGGDRGGVGFGGSGRGEERTTRLSQK